MTNPHHTMGHSGDAPVRPGTSDALTARTIDATVHPPLVRAQETVTALVPRVAQAAVPLKDPLLLGLIALTLLFVLVARRMHYRPSALVLSALLVMGLTSFQPMRPPEPKRVVRTDTPRTRTQVRPHRSWDDAPPVPEPPDVPSVPDQPESVQIYIPPELVDWSRDAMRSAEQMVRDNERMQEAMRELRYRLREEARRHRWHRMTAKYRFHTNGMDPIDIVLTP